MYILGAGGVIIKRGHETNFAGQMRLFCVFILKRYIIRSNKGSNCENEKRTDEMRGVIIEQNDNNL